MPRHYALKLRFKKMSLQFPNILHVTVSSIIKLYLLIFTFVLSLRGRGFSLVTALSNSK